MHSSRTIPPHSVISGTTYVTMPKGTSAIKFEDPRLAMMMAAPPRQSQMPGRIAGFIYRAPEAGEVCCYVGKLAPPRVPMNMAEEDQSA